MRSLKWTLIIRIIAAIYIVYLAISMINEIRKGAVTGGMVILGVVAVVAFFAFAVWAVVSSIRTWMAEEKARPDEEDEEAVRRAEEEEKERIRQIASAENRRSSLFARMERFSDETAEDAATAEESAEADGPDGDGEPPRDPEDE